MKTLAPIFFRGMLKLTTVMLATVLGLVLWHDLLAVPWLIYPDMPLAVVNGTVKAGDTLQVVMSRCNTKAEVKPYTVLRELRQFGETTQIKLPSRQTDLKPGCYREVIRLTQIPPKTPPGVYAMYGYSLIEGRLFPRSVSWNTEFFEVVQ